MDSPYTVITIGLGLILVFYLLSATNRTARRLTEYLDLFRAIIAQINNLDKKIKRQVDVLEDIRAGRGPEADCVRMFGEAEDQKAALFQLLKRSDSVHANKIATGLKREVLRLYQEVIQRFPDSQEARIARERCEEIERVVSA